MFFLKKELNNMDCGNPSTSDLFNPQWFPDGTAATENPFPINIT